MSKLKHTKYNQTGLSLIEIQVALVIGLILTAGAIQLFIGNQRTYRTEAALAQMQSLGRFAVEAMAQEIRIAGYTGCTSVRDITTNYSALDDPTYAFGTNEQKIGGSDAQGGGWNPALPAVGNLNALFIAGTDTFTVQHADQCATQLASNTTDTPGSLDIYGQHTCDLDANDVVIVTDCVNMDVAQILAVTGNTNQVENITLAAGTNIVNTFDTTSTVHKLVSNTFYIAPSELDANEPALWMSNWDPDGAAGTTAADYTPIEIASGVEDMQVLYGVDTAGDQFAETYVTADQVPAVSADGWRAVRSIRVNLLLRSADNVTSEPQVFPFNGANVNDGGGGVPQDNRLRTLYSTTVTVRNQLQ